MQLINLFPRQLRAALRPRQRTTKGTPPGPRPKPEPPPNKTTGQQMGRIFCEALGESPRNVQCIELIADARDAAIVKITRFVSDSEAGIVGAQMREFALVEVEEEQTKHGPLD